MKKGLSERDREKMDREEKERRKREKKLRKEVKQGGNMSSEELLRLDEVSEGIFWQFWIFGRNKKAQMSARKLKNSKF